MSDPPNHPTLEGSNEEDGRDTESNEENLSSPVGQSYAPRDYSHEESKLEALSSPSSRTGSVVPDTPIRPSAAELLVAGTPSRSVRSRPSSLRSGGNSNVSVSNYANNAMVAGTPLRRNDENYLPNQNNNVLESPLENSISETPDHRRRTGSYRPPSSQQSVSSFQIPSTPMQMEEGSVQLEMSTPLPTNRRSNNYNVEQERYGESESFRTDVTPISELSGSRQRSIRLMPRSERNRQNENQNNDTRDISTRLGNRAIPEDYSRNGDNPLPPSIPNEVEEEEPVVVQEEAVIWGTDVHVPTAEAAFRDFLRTFVSVEESERKRRKLRYNDDDMDEDIDDHSSVSSSSSSPQKEPIYLKRLRDISLGLDLSENSLFSTATPTKNSLDLDCQHLYFHSPACQRLYHQLVKYPQEIVPLMDLIIGHEYSRILQQNHLHQDSEEDIDTDALNIPIQIRPHHLRNVSNMRSLDPLHMDSLICLKGMVVRTSPIIPDLKIAFFSCSVCGTTKDVAIDRGKITEPSGRCETCSAVNTYTLIHNRCTFADKQMVRLQETPDEVPAGETPASIVLFAYDDLVDAVRPGDRVEVSGVFRAMARRVHPKISKVKSVYKTYIDVIHFKRIGKEQVGEGRGFSGKGKNAFSGTTLSEERISELEALSRDRNIYEKLTNSLAPSIWELDNVKKGVLCMLFGGNSKRIKRGSYSKNGQMQNAAEFDSDDEDGDDDHDGEQGSDRQSSRKLSKRGDINILLCGDPGTSKSQLLSYVHKLSPRGVYTSGKGSSAVGLTASVVRDPETRELVLESGALVLSDLGICCIDEFDKMADTTRAILHEAMEQQTVSIAKAGIIATLNARTSILASANPVESRYNPRKSVVENIQLPPTLLSRFDLIYLILDQPNADSDRRLAKHLVGLYYEEPDVVEPPLSHDLLRDYILYARENIHPEVSDLATQELIRSYLEMRRSGNGSSRTISATPRQLESLIRISEALAKMRYSRIVDRKDVQEAVRLMRVATQAAATDPRTGRIDMDMIATGRSQVERDARDALNVAVKELLAERRGNRMAVSDVRKQITEITSIEVSHEEMIENLRLMESDGIIQFNERAQTIFVKTKIGNS